MLSGNGHGESLPAFCLEVLSRIPLRRSSLYVNLCTGCCPAAFRMLPVLIDKSNDFLVSLESRKLTDNGERDVLIRQLLIAEIPIVIINVIPGIQFALQFKVVHIGNVIVEKLITVQGIVVDTYIKDICGTVTATD